MKGMSNDMENDIKKLRGSLIYKMSQGSKELYHSNIWSWLIEQDSEFINVGRSVWFFRDLPHFIFSDSCRLASE